MFTSCCELNPWLPKNVFFTSNKQTYETIVDKEILHVALTSITYDVCAFQDVILKKEQQQQRMR